MEDKEEDIKKKLEEKEAAEKKKGSRGRNGRFASKKEKDDSGDTAKSGDDGDDSDSEDDTPRHVFLTKQPNCIEFGQLKPYQLESLNWMIHLAEKGINGILADEV